MCKDVHAPPGNYDAEVCGLAALQSCRVDILETDAVVNGGMGLVCTNHRGEVQAGEFVLINAAGSGVGLAMIQTAPPSK